MKHLPLKNKSYNYIETAFKTWLDILGYNKTATYYLPIHVREFLYYLEQENINKIKDLHPIHIVNYYNKLKQRTNRRQQSGALSAAYLNKHQQALKLFCDYLRQSGRLMIAYPDLTQEKKEDNKIEVLTQKDIKSLFEATELLTTKPELELLQARDKAIIAILYFCGLRRTEAVSLNFEDVNLDTATVHVKHGKGYKERLVPIHPNNIKYLENYMYDSRIALTKDRQENAFFLSMRKTRMTGQSMLVRLKQMQHLSDNQSLKSKNITLHTLRHSIATHLLQNGMSLEQISRFLGHSSLESTQIYTHLINDNVDSVLHEHQ
ncbi:MAG: tyrosine-type recombinase/integrase [Putridiphycobacter sp.]